MTQTPDQPSAEGFREFASSRRMLFAPTPAELSANVSALKAHAVYRWLAGQPAYKAAEASLSKKKAFRSATLPAQGAQEGDYELLWFATLIAQCLAIYVDLLHAHPDDRKAVITSKDLHNAREAATVLRNLIERGLTLPGQSTLDLYTLLENLPENTDSQLMTSERAGDHVPTMCLIRTLALMLHSHYGDMMPAVIYHVVSTVESVPKPESLERSIKRHLADLRG